MTQILATYILDAREPLSMIRTYLEVFVPKQTLDNENFQDYILGVVERIVYGFRSSGIPLQQTVEGWKIPDDVLGWIDDAVGDHISGQLTTFHVADPKKTNIVVSFVNRSTIKVDLVSTIKPKSEEQQLIERIQNGLDNGDWYSEKIRTLVGR